MIGFYFSGTGNTKYCIEKFLAAYGGGAEAFPIEDAIPMEKLKQERDIVFAYPIYYSNLPKIVRDFVEENRELWNGKRVFIIATMGLFSGDGAGVAARLLKKYGARITGGLHVKMPDCICDEKALKRPYLETKEIVAAAGRKIEWAAAELKNGTPAKEGLGICYHMAGLFGQRLWFINKTRHYSDRLRIDTEACTGCGRCVSACPMKNLSLRQGKAAAGARCTMCYRCVNQCPGKAITLLGKRVIVQQHVEEFLG